jgi:catechol-2,3-dioxygenase
VRIGTGAAGVHAAERSLPVLTCAPFGCTDRAITTHRSREAIMASPKKLSHLVLQTNRRDEMVEWYCTVLGADLLYQNKFIAFISYDDEHHRVAFIDPGPLADKAPSEGKTARAGGEVGLHHVAFTFDPDSLADHYEELKGQGISPHRCVNHGMTTSMYYYDPDRNQVELLFDNFHNARDGRDYMTSRSASDKNPVGIDFDPDEMVARIRKGLDIEELADINA